MNLKVSMDLDGCLCDFWGPYLARFGEPKKDSDVTFNVQNALSRDKEFWLNLPVLNPLNFTPKQYTTARIIPKQWIKEYLEKEFFPTAPVYVVRGYSLSKYSKVRMGGCDVHVDDSLSVFMDLNKKGVPCLLLDAPGNRHWDEPVGRIYSLDKDEIEDAYHLFKDTMFPHFNEFVK